MPRISYPDLDRIDDPKVHAILDRARREGVPRPESQAIRAHVPELLKTFTAAWMTSFANGVLDHGIKELCRVYVSKTVDCGYCAGQRSMAAGADESHYEDLLRYAQSDRYTDREKTALAYADAVVWDSNLADDRLWDSLRRHFTEPEIVELGFFVAFTSGQQRWIKTLRLGHREILADTEAGLVGASS